MGNLGLLLNYRFGFNSLGMGPKACISNKLFGNGDTTIPQNVLNVEQLRIFFFFLNHFKELDFDRV